MSLPPPGLSLVIVGHWPCLDMDHSIYALNSHRQDVARPSNGLRLSDAVRRLAVDPDQGADVLTALMLTVSGSEV